MPDLVLYFAFWARLICLPSLALAAIILYSRNRILPTLMIAAGLVSMTIGSLLEVFAPYHEATLDEMQNVLSTQSVPTSWYIGSFIFNIGMIIATAGLFYLSLYGKCSMTKINQKDIR